MSTYVLSITLNNEFSEEYDDVEILLENLHRMSEDFHKIKDVIKNMKPLDDRCYFNIYGKSYNVLRFS